jgi:cellulose synthase/poly-beta-1,6-N-acetylglucosamine synthase-like glycosyltransferase
MEMTLRVHELKRTIVFEPEAAAFSESPSNLHVLWKQRVRWIRGYIQTIKLHKRMMIHGKMGVWLSLNFMANVVFPWLMFFAFWVFMASFIRTSYMSVSGLFLAIGFFGIISSFVVVCFSLILDGNFRKYASYFKYFAMWVAYSMFLDLVCMSATLQELTHTKRQWNAWTKTGVITDEKTRPKKAAKNNVGKEQDVQTSPANQAVGGDKPHDAK